MADSLETPQGESLTGLPPLPSIEYFQRDYRTGFTRPSGRALSGLGFFLVLSAVLGTFFFLSGESDGVASTLVSPEDEISLAPAAPISVEPEIVVGDSHASTTIGDSGVELASSDETDEDDEVNRPFSANRAACTSLYGNPTADVAFRFQQTAPPQSTDTTVGQESTETTADTTTTAVPATPAPTTAAPTTAAPTTTAPTTAAPTTTVPPTAAPTTTSAPVTAPPAPPGWVDAGNGINVPIELIVIRCCESRNNYVAQNSVSSASGAYQFVDGTWAGRFGVSKARFATRAQQDIAAVDLWRARGTQPWEASKHCWGLDA